MSTSADLVGYTHDFLAEFIQLYRSYPCLWQIRYKGYKDRLLRNRAYDALVQKLREVNPVANRETVIRKINTLRTAFRREYKKSVQTDVDKIEPPSPVPTPEASPLPTFQPVILETEGSYSRRISSSTIEPCRRKYQHESYQDRQTKEQSRELSPRPFATCMTDDDFETFGRYVASKLRKSMPRQCIIAEKIIADVLLRANLGTLEETTCLTEKVPSRCFLVMGDR
ncbi:uncharacterized protein LOC114874521 isoform X2 [Osmia bicornis bicornis]|uniref:uncharacterized protein LOC114874521 isoform X2 n=1 Tax=Osmia bicornis bicornis TaxID=1437191 RepID=UPI0010F8A8DC|nr:uncharacterized protein LOC114874521 isoform X2 [Osmia bicornis bicornis]